MFACSERTKTRAARRSRLSLLRDVNTVIDFTAPVAVMDNIEACLREKKNMVVGTTGWHAHAGSVRAEVEEDGRRISARRQFFSRRESLL